MRDVDERWKEGKRDVWKKAALGEKYANLPARHG